LVSITPFGGVNEIGGNKLLIEADGASVMLDFGLSYKGRGRFFTDPYVQPRDVSTMVELGVIPDIPRAYTDEGDRPFDAIVLSHAHRDHSGHVSLTRKDIDIHAGEAASRILLALRDTSRERFEFSLGDRELKRFHTRDVLGFDPIEVQPIHVDHSVPGAYGFIIRTPEGIIGYTGDFRMHGPMSQMSLEFMDALKSNRPDILLMEHTNILEGEVSTEAEVESKLSSIIRASLALVVGDFTLADVDRYKSFYSAATENGRQLVITAKRACIIDSLMEDPRISVPNYKDGVRVLEKVGARQQTWEDSICGKWGTVSITEIHEHQDKYVLVVPPADIQSVLKISARPGSVFLFSSSEPFNEEMELDYDRLMNWLDAIGMPAYKVHASGHAMPMDLRRFVSEVKPRIVVPIHGEHPEMVMRYFRDLGCEVYLPTVAEPIPL
jgi:ribonuclease J